MRIVEVNGVRRGPRNGVAIFPPPPRHCTSGRLGTAEHHTETIKAVDGTGTCEKRRWRLKDGSPARWRGIVLSAPTPLDTPFALIHRDLRVIHALAELSGASSAGGQKGHKCID